MTRRIPDVVLERYRLKELPDTSARAVEAMLASDPALRARLEALERSDEEIRHEYPSRAFVRDVPAPPRRAVARLAIAASLALVAVMIVATLPRPDADRIKGGHPLIALYRRTAAGSERLADGDIARPGDLLRVGYVSAGRGYGVILSIDGRGAVTMHLPLHGDQAAALSAGSLVLLDSAYELDDAPRIERFYFVTGTEPFKVGPLVAAARRAGGAPDTLPLPSGLEQVTFAVQKEVRK